MFQFPVSIFIWWWLMENNLFSAKLSTDSHSSQKLSTASGLVHMVIFSGRITSILDMSVPEITGQKVTILKELSCLTSRFNKVLVYQYPHWRGKLLEENWWKEVQSWAPCSCTSQLWTKLWWLIFCRNGKLGYWWNILLLSNTL